MRTTATIGNTTRSGDNCDTCGTVYSNCTASVLSRGEACCSRCNTADTHNEQLDPDTTTPAKFNIGDKVCWAGQSLCREVRGTHGNWLWVKPLDAGSPMTVKASDCEPWVDPQRQRLIDLLAQNETRHSSEYLADYLLMKGVTFKEDS